MKILNISNHDLSEAQNKELQDIGFECYELTADLKQKWGNIKPNTMDMVINELLLKAKEFNAVKIDGFAPAIIKFLSKWDKPAFYAYSVRESVETKDKEGNVTKTSIFKHEAFYRYN